MMYCKEHQTHYNYGSDCPYCMKDGPVGKALVLVTNYHGEIHQDILLQVKSHMSNEDKVEMEVKLYELASTKKFASYEARLVFEDAFRSGYLATRAKRVK
jgi:hypothetical protein